MLGETNPGIVDKLYPVPIPEPVTFNVKRILSSVGGKVPALSQPTGCVRAALNVQQLIGVFKVVEQEPVQPFMSVTVSEYIPPIRPLSVGEVAPLLHKYVKGIVPPVIVGVIDPPFGFRQVG